MTLLVTLLDLDMCQNVQLIILIIVERHIRLKSNCQWDTCVLKKSVIASLLCDVPLTKFYFLAILYQIQMLFLYLHSIC